MAFHRYSENRSEFARHFILLAATVISLAVGAGWGLTKISPARTAGDFRFPPVFWMSTLALVTGSIALHRASGFVALEKQAAFRTHLIVGLIAGTLFVAFQIYAMWYLLRMTEPAYRHATAEEATALGVKPYVFVAAFLHALHFLLAMLFLVYVTLYGLAGRYDHEYHWGVRVCAWFWHGLGIVWIMILCVCGIVVI